MEEIFIQNKGMNKTWIHTPGTNNIKESDWNIHYDGNKANIDMNLNNNGFKQHYQLELENDDLEELLSIPSEPLTLDKRLMNDFLIPMHGVSNEKSRKKRKPLLIKKKSRFTHKNPRKYTHLSSPGIKDQYFIPNKPFSKKKNHTYSLYKLPKKYSRKNYLKSI